MFVLVLNPDNIEATLRFWGAHPYGLDGKNKQLGYCNQEFLQLLLYSFIPKDFSIIPSYVRYFNIHPSNIKLAAPSNNIFIPQMPLDI